MAAVVYYAYETAKIACILLANNSVKSSHLLCFGSICLRNMNVKFWCIKGCLTNENKNAIQKEHIYFARRFFI